MKAIIISGGNIEDDFALGFLKEEAYDVLIAADRGMEFCRRHGIRIDYMVGDFDSADKDTLEWYEKQQIPIRYLKPEKDDTDTQSAFSLAQQSGVGEVVLLGCTGTRLDHVLANIQLLAYGEERGIRMSLVDAHNRITLHQSSFSIGRKEQFGKYVSFFAVDGPVKEFSLDGFWYPLHNHVLKCLDGSLSVSNEIAEETARVTFPAGRVLMVESRD